MFLTPHRIAPARLAWRQQGHEGDNVPFREVL